MKTYSHDISIVLGGAAGQGIQTVEALLVTVLKQEGYRVFATKEYMSRIRGGSNSTEIRITSKPRAAFTSRIDFLFAMDGNVMPHLKNRISQETIILGDAKKVNPPTGGGAGPQFVDIPFVQFANELGDTLFTSTIAVGVALGILEADENIFFEYLRKRFAKKGEEVVNKNIEAATKGYAYGKHIAFDQGIEVHLDRDPKAAEELLMSGTEAVALGALAGGCNYISSYPMSPSTGVLTFLSKCHHEFGVVFDQAEDEIAAINQGLGAWYAGARALVTTSGGGFALMQEGVSLAGMIESPMVIHLAQRPGPATGLPTRTEQADLNLALYSGHGEFPRAIFAPGSHEEAFALTQRAFDQADKYQVPIFILTDQYILDSIRSFDPKAISLAPLTRHIVKTKKEYVRYAAAASGVSPRGIPGYGEGLVMVDSDEHDVTGHITESAEVRVAMHEKRLKKGAGLAKEALPPTIFGNLKAAQTVVVVWGSNKGVLAEALEKVGAENVAGLHFSQVYPVASSVQELLDGKKIIVLENNASGQFGHVLERECQVRIAERILQYDGDPFAIEDVVNKLKKIL